MLLNERNKVQRINIPQLISRHNHGMSLSSPNSTSSNGVGTSAEMMQPYSQNKSRMANGALNTTPISSFNGVNKMNNRIMESAISNSTPSPNSGDKLHHYKRRSDANQIQSQKQKRSANDYSVMDDEDEANMNADSITDLIYEVRSVLPKIAKMSEEIGKIKSNVTDIVTDVNEMMEKMVPKDGKKTRKTKASDFLWKTSFVNTFIFKINGKLVKVGEFTGINAKKEVAEIIKYHQDEGLWESPSFNGVSLKEEIQEYLHETFEKIDQPTKVAYSVGQFLWHADHFLENHMTTLKPKGNRVSDANRNEIPHEQKQLFTGVMLYCGGFLIDQFRNGEGKRLAHDKDNWLEWLSNGREVLNTRGKQDLNGKKTKSSITKEMPDDFVPIFLRSQEYWDELRQKEKERETALQEEQELRQEELRQEEFRQNQMENDSDLQEDSNSHGNDMNGNNDISNENALRDTIEILEQNNERMVEILGKNNERMDATENSLENNNLDALIPANNSDLHGDDLINLVKTQKRQSIKRTISWKSADGRERGGSRESERNRNKIPLNYSILDKWGLGFN